MILHWLDDVWVDRLQEVLVEHLLPVSLVAAEEHIAKLGKACDIVQVQFFQCADELGDHLVKSKLDSKHVLVTRIVALQLVNFGEHCLSVPLALKHKTGLLLMDASHCVCHLGGSRNSFSVNVLLSSGGRAVIKVSYHARERLRNNLNEKVKGGK